ncbi:hypothetical protein [Aureimonas sp. AU12]|uniref:hypothetical protein n=1 Tax=Aureimonas sp. AU12 TaxID=1638161 RepID=UPI0007866773|nr:hypothetical protein [Aureimonas sp. AU12]
MIVVLSPLGASIVLGIAVSLIMSGACGITMAGPCRLMAVMGLVLGVAGAALLIALCAGVA